MKYFSLNLENLSRYSRFCCVSIPFALLAGTALLYFGASLSPDATNAQQGKYNSRAIEALSYSNAVVKQCIGAQATDNKDECGELYDLLEVLQSTLALGAQENMAESTFHLSRLAYWQYLATGWTVIFIMLAVGASYAFLYEASQAIKFLQNTLQTTKDSSEAELQPYLSIVDVSVQTGEPPFGGGDGWIDITFKNVGKTPARNFRNHFFEKTPGPLFSQYVEMLDGAPVVHTIRSPGEQTQANETRDTTLMNFINTGEERTVRCPIITDILDRKVKQLYMETEWERRNERVTLPQFEGYSIHGSIDFSNFNQNATTRRLRFELIESIDNGKSFTITEDRTVP